MIQNHETLQFNETNIWIEFRICITSGLVAFQYSQNKPISYNYYHFKSDDKLFHSKNGSEKISV